ncbi:hypothetical protein VCHA35O141_60183 [Vibrio chagasii]|nr:hypothetical protein VCHA35O141_60183 [Vibrio chagasii]
MTSGVSLSLVIILLLWSSRMANYGKAHYFKACRLTPFFKLLATGHWNRVRKVRW